MNTFEQGFEQVMAHAAITSRYESVPLGDALGRIVASTQYSIIDVPGYDNSAMDGYAVRSHDIHLGASYPVSQRIVAGEAPHALADNTIARIFTGAMVPAGANAIILQEDALVDLNDDSDSHLHVSFTELPRADQHIRLSGQDIKKGAVVVEKGRRLTSADIGLLASVGIAELPCYTPIKVAFFSTGDELKNPGDTLSLGKIYNSNRYFLAAKIKALGAIPIDLGCCPDSEAATREYLMSASEQADCIVTTGGMSVGEEDYVRQQVESLGAILFWKLAIKPGKPVAFGHIQGTPFFGLPGNPVSSFVTFHLLMRPWLLKTMGYDDARAVNLSQSSLGSVAAKATFDWHNSGKRLDFLRGQAFINSAGEVSVTRYQNQSSGVLSSIAQCNVLIPVQPGQQWQAGDACQIIALSDFGELTLKN
ncbi:molybdopterin molybdotransferase MoeA [Pseudomonadales bacterium]|nr:molybdopterin molybdotransferase MoeA [Pseudomonadales bacterium]